MAGRQLTPPIQPDAALSAEARAVLRGPLPGRRWLPLWPVFARLYRRRRSRAQAPALAALVAELVAGTERIRLGDMDAVVVTPRRRGAVSGSWALFVHGGGYVMGHAVDETAVLLADELGCPVVSLDYERAPEARFPAALERAAAAWPALTARFSGRFVAVGESAGAGFLLALLLRLQAGGPMPAGLGLFTPWADLQPVGDSFHGNARRDPVLRWRGLLDGSAAAYAGSADRADPGLSPVHGAYGPDFPPTLITTGTRDLFLSLCIRQYWRMRRAGVAVELRVWDGMWHSFNARRSLPEAVECRAEMTAFLLGRLQVCADGTPAWPRMTLPARDR